MYSIGINTDLCRNWNVSPKNSDDLYLTYKTQEIRRPYACCVSFYPKSQKCSFPSHCSIKVKFCILCNANVQKCILVQTCDYVSGAVSDLLIFNHLFLCDWLMRVVELLSCLIVHTRMFLQYFLLNIRSSYPSLKHKTP